jgi:hypothetical protein
MTVQRTKDPVTDPVVTPGPIDLPTQFGTGSQAVANLDTALPLTMFPVRLATRLHRPVSGEPPTQLWLRIFPDLIHADGHLPLLSKTEIAIGRAYWERRWRANGDTARRTEADVWLTSQLDAHRGAWVIAQTAPRNQSAAPNKPVPAERPLQPAPDFSALQPRTTARPTLARLLPDFWHVTVRHSIEFVERKWSTRVRRDLAMAPSLADLSGAGDIRNLLEDEGIWWMVDFDAAVEAGMALRIPWNPPAGGPRFATEVIVFGVRSDNAGADTELTALLDAHRFTAGLEIVPQGTPTNNTDTVSAGFAAAPSDVQGHFDRQTSAPRITRPAADRIGTTTAANAASIALGLTGVNAFDRAEHAGLLSTRWAADMNRALWPATFEYLLARVLATAGIPALADDDRAWLADWCRDWVRGGAFLPAFRVGSQPYGLFPVARRPAVAGTTRRAHLQAVLADLLDDWDVSHPRVANFSAARGGRFGEGPPTPEEEALRLASVLGAVPHPTAFRLRTANERFDAVAAAWNDGIAEMEELLLQSHDDLHNQVYRLTWSDEINDGPLADQRYGLERLRQFADQVADDTKYSQQMRDAAARSRDHIDDVLRPITAAHEMRAETKRWSAALGTGPFSAAHVPTADDPPLWYVEYGDDGAAPDGTFPTLRLVPDRTPDEAATILRNFARSARVGSVGIVNPANPRSLLEKLCEHAVASVPADRAEELALGLDGLAAMLESDDVVDPLAELTRLLRESLGLATHRFDAWLCSLANERLSTLRTKTPATLQIGAYGWVVNLEPDRGDGVDSHGFIHAPSLDHAATAAVLRSAWLNFATRADDAPFGIDLSSDRVRRAHWLLEGVRNGVDLAELLGARFERRLHDAGRSALIADVRRIVLDATGHPGRPANAIVDGLALAVAYSDSTAVDPVHDAIEQWRATLPGHPADGLDRPLHDTVADLDATADLLTAQSVHSVLKGNLAEAAATLSVAGAGDAGIPQLRVPDVHRESQLVTHRVVAILPRAMTSTTGSSLLTIADPALAAWLGTLLPNAAGIEITGELGSAGTGAAWQRTVAELGLGAIELVLLAAVGGELGASQLGALLAARCRLETGSGSDVQVAIGGAIGDVAVVAGALRAVIGSARPLVGDDIASVEGLDHVIDVDELDGRRRALAARLGELARSTPGLELLAERFADFVALDPGAVVAAMESTDDVERRVGEMLQRAAAAAESLEQPLPPDWSARTRAAQADLLATRLRAAVGVPLPVLTSFTLADRDELSASLASSARRLGAQLTPLSWLLGAGRVHDGAGRCAEALDLAEALNPTAPVTIQVAQLPDVAGEPWVAVDAPTAPGGRLDVVAVTDAAAAIAAGPVCGLIFDGWTEPVPGRRATTGVALHFDRPGAQPPQAVLLGLPPESGGWTVEHIEWLLLETLELAAMRAVGPETLARLGHTLPAVFLSAGAAVSIVPDELDADVDLPGHVDIPDIDDIDDLDDVLGGLGGAGGMIEGSPRSGRRRRNSPRGTA